MASNKSVSRQTRLDILMPSRDSYRFCVFPTADQHAVCRRRFSFKRSRARARNKNSKFISIIHWDGECHRFRTLINIFTLAFPLFVVLSLNRNRMNHSHIHEYRVRGFMSHYFFCIAFETAHNVTGVSVVFPTLTHSLTDGTARKKKQKQIVAILRVTTATLWRRVMMVSVCHVFFFVSH